MTDQRILTKAVSVCLVGKVFRNNSTAQISVLNLISKMCFLACLVNQLLNNTKLNRK